LKRLSSVLKYFLKIDEIQTSFYIKSSYKDRGVRLASRRFKLIVLDFGMDSNSNIKEQLDQIAKYLVDLRKSIDEQQIYLALVAQIINWRQEINSPQEGLRQRPLIQGILGGQGTGKTTLCRLLCKLLKIAGYSAVSLSLDDLYKTYLDRQQLQIHEPKLRWRGPPGTHDIQLGIDTLEQIRLGNSQQQIALPRFDKSLWAGMGDRTTPELVNQPDIVFFEGWFVGVLPIPEESFQDNYQDDRQPLLPLINPLNSLVNSPIITEVVGVASTVENRAFALYSNQQLQNYLPLWQLVDKLIMLYPKDYQYSLQWRLQAEQEMIQSGKPGMDLEQIRDFVQYFWQALPPQLFLTPLTKQPTPVDLIIPLDQNHNFEKICYPV